MHAIHRLSAGPSVLAVVLASLAGLAGTASPGLTATAAPAAERPHTVVPQSSTIVPDESSTVERMPLWRVQVRLVTGRLPKHGTTGHPAIRFNGTTSGVRTLNPPYARAFMGNTDGTYDVALFSKPSDITMLRVGLGSSDDVCVRQVELLLNGRRAFSWAGKNGTCQRVYAGKNLDFSYEQLRRSVAWKSLNRPSAPPTRVTKSELLSRIANITGSSLLSTPSLTWNKLRPPVIVRSSTKSVRVAYWVFDHSRSPLVRLIRVQYDVRFSIGPDWQLRATRDRPSCCALDGSNRAVAELDTALSRMTTYPPMLHIGSYGVDAAATLRWTILP